MKPFSKIRATILEYVGVSKNEAPEFQKLPTDQMSHDAEYKSHRFIIRKHLNGNTGMFTIHDKETGAHIGTLSYNKRASPSGKEHIAAEITKSPTCGHSRMMSEVMAHLSDNCGHKFFSSTTLSDAGKKVWEHLAKTNNVHAVSDKSGKMQMVKKNLSPNELNSYKETCEAHKAHKQFYLGGSK